MEDTGKIIRGRELNNIVLLLKKLFWESIQIL
jgi:hypothetical protein